MKVGIYLRVDAPSQSTVANAILDGCRIKRDEPFIFSNHADIYKADTVILFGIGGDAKAVWNLAKSANVRTVLLDKPYIRQVALSDKPRYWVLRVAVDESQPLKYFQAIKHSPERWDALHISTTPYSLRNDGVLLLDGASNKFVAWTGLGNGIGTDVEQWGDWGQRMVNKIRAYSDVPVVYRPRPDNNPTPYITGADISVVDDMYTDFRRSRVVVSYGGNIGYNAVIAGVPHFAMGDSIARPLSETDWSRITTPFTPSEAARQQWLADIAWCQWNLDEFRSGVAWKYIRESMEIIDSL